MAELRPPTELSVFTKNTNVVGAYVESAVRQLISRYVMPLQVCTGTVIDQSNIPGDPKLPQIDTIVWTPSPVPAVFQVGDFALVPKSSALGVLEIKSSFYRASRLDDSLDPTLIRRVTAEAMPAEKQAGEMELPALGVVCVKLAKQKDSALAKMRNKDRVVILFDESKNDIIPRTKDIYRLVNFLAFLRFRGRQHAGLVRINTDVLK